MILTIEQQESLKSEALKTEAWRSEEDLQRRRDISSQVRSTIENSQIHNGGRLDHKTLCHLISLLWQIQNLNGMQMPRLLGSYHYKVHFGNYEGTRDDLLAQREVENGGSQFHEGADLGKMSEALRQINSDASSDQYQGAKSLLEIPGAGVAIVSGFLQLCHPDKFAIINQASLAPFRKNGRISVSKGQLDEALQQAKEKFAAGAAASNPALREIFRWQILMSEALNSCQFADFHELDQFIWTVEGGDRLDLSVAMQPILERLPDEADNVKVRAAAEAKARTLIEANLGRLSPAQFGEIFQLLNTCVGKNGTVFDRFAPAFVGHNANLLLERVDELNVWISRLWSASDEALLPLLSQFWEERFSGGGKSFPTAILYLRDKEKFSVWMKALENGLYTVVGGLPAKIRTGFAYLQYCDHLKRLRRKFDIPAELHDWTLYMLASQKVARGGKSTSSPSGSFPGFRSEAFQFLADLGDHNSASWFDDNRDQFKAELDKPLRALFKDLGDEVITSLDPELETTPKSNKCISKIRKNTYGNQDIDSYHTSFWGAFYRKQRTKQTDCQLFVALRSQGLSYGLFLGEQADEIRQKLIANMNGNSQLAKRVFDHFSEAGFQFVPGGSTALGQAVEVTTYEQFAALVADSSFNVCRVLTPEEATSMGPTLAKRIADDFRLLFPLFKLATAEDPISEVSPYLHDEPPDAVDEGITLEDLAAATYLESEFFQKLDRYLADKQQIIFFGPPGTGKTFVALKYAEYLTQDKSKVQTVQFHPSYGYEDFMEGLRPVTRDGHLTYEVQSGVFKLLCDRARADLQNKYVLIIDEINRGNLPRILGELLFLLERREETTQLPYSKKAFSIPRNVVILGTMNSSDRSIALMDLALRRRFHFMLMEPRWDVLAAWLKRNNKPQWVEAVFRRLNDMLRNEQIGEDRLVGHAHFMSPQLSEDHLALIWEGTILPLLGEYFFASPDRLKAFELEKVLMYVEGLELEDAAAEDDEFLDDEQNSTQTAEFDS